MLGYLENGSLNLGRLMTGKLVFLNVGTPSTLIYLGKELPSSFVKTAPSNPVWLNRDGLAGDE